MQFDLNRWWAKSQFNEQTRLRLYRKLAKMLGSGLPMLKVLEELHQRASQNGEKPNEPLAVVLDDCRRAVQNGRLLSEGLESWIPQNEQMIILAGEQAGRLESTLSAVIQVVQSSKKIKSVIFGGIAYPVSVFILILAYIHIFGTKVIPEFARMVDPSAWKGAAKSLHVMSLFVQSYMVFLVLFFITLVVVIVASMPRWTGSLRAWFDKVAPYSIYRLVNGSGFLLSFSALQFAGVTVERSLIRLSDMASPWMRERLDGALMGVKSGLNCGEALRNSGYGFPSDEVIDDLCVYAEYKGFAEALQTLADEWIEEGIEQVSIQMKILNSVAIIALAMVIGWLVTGFFGIQQEIAAMTRGVR